MNPPLKREVCQKGPQRTCRSEVSVFNSHFDRSFENEIKKPIAQSLVIIYMAYPNRDTSGAV
jgi:hypothetical protein